MFWKFDLHTSSHLEALLDKEDVTLIELMDEEDVLQECKAQNRRLLLFVCQDQCMLDLVHMITTEPPAGVEETKRFKYPNIACELLTCDVGVINDKLGNEELLLENLYAFLEQPSPLNPLLASFFSKTIGNLITRKTEQVISFLRRKEGFLSLVLKHIDTSAMMDVLLRLISCVEPPPLRLETLIWLNEEKLAQRLIELIHPERDEERQSNASQTLCDIIRLSRDQANQLQEISQPDPLLTVLESQECVEQLLQNMFSAECSESCIINGIQVLLTLLEIRRPVVDGVMDAQGFERSYTVNSSILLAIQPHLIHFHQLLLEPPKRNPMLTTLGVLEEPLGNTRLHVARLVASLLYTSSASHAVVAQELCRLNTMDLLLDLFFKYTWTDRPPPAPPAPLAPSSKDQSQDMTVASHPEGQLPSPDPPAPSSTSDTAPSSADTPVATSISSTAGGATAEGEVTSAAEGTDDMETDLPPPPPPPLDDDDADIDPARTGKEGQDASIDDPHPPQSVPRTSSQGKVNPYSVIDITPLQLQQLEQQHGPSSSASSPMEPKEPEGESQNINTSPVGITSGYSVPVPCGYATPSGVPLITPAYTTPVIIRHLSVDEDVSVVGTGNTSVDSVFSEEYQPIREEDALAKWASDPANTAWMENPDEVIYDDVPRENSDSNTDPDEMIYDDVELGEEGGCNSSLDNGWSSSEFESYDEASDGEGRLENGLPHAFMRGKPPQRKTHMQKLVKAAKDGTKDGLEKTKAVVKKGRSFIKTKSFCQERKSACFEDEESELFIEVDCFNVEPVLCPAPEGLSQQQLVRRCILGSILESEKNYLDALKKILEQYEKPLSQIEPRLLSDRKLKMTFYRVREILQCHFLFQIALASRVAEWDSLEMIGDVFVASFSKSMVLDAYSEYVNNFSTAMTVVRKTCAAKPGFLEFLKHRQETSGDRMTLYGLMMKPIQRFPQFILLLQDMLKNTPVGHADRLPLQMALTELETLAEKLNEKKREADQRCEIRHIAKAMNERYLNKLLSNGSRYLIRSDDMVETVYNERGEIIKTKERRLFLLNDVLMCATPNIRCQDGSGSGSGNAPPDQKFLLKWSVPLSFVEALEFGSSEDMADNSRYPTSHSGEKVVINAKPNKLYMGPGQLYQDLQNLIHDLSLVNQISSMISSLKGNYQNVNPTVAHDWVSGLQRLILKKEEEIRAADRCRIQLQLPGKHDKSGKPTYFSAVFNTLSPAIKQSWISNLQMAKLALEEDNLQGWFFAEDDGNQIKKQKHPLLLRQMPVVMSKLQEFKVECAVHNPEPHINTESTADTPVVGHGCVWVASCTNQMGQISIVAMQSSSPKVTECFNVESRILCMAYVPAEQPQENGEKVPENNHVPAAKASDSPSVCLGMEEGSIIVYKSSQRSKKVRLQHFFTPDKSTVTSLVYKKHSLYVGLVSGSVAVYSRLQDGVWSSEKPKMLKLGVLPVKAMLAVEEHIWASTGGQVFIISTHTHCVERQLEAHQEEGMVVSHMVVAGVGIWIAFSSGSTLRLFHTETLEHLQDINIATPVHNTLPGNQRVSVSSLLVCHGLLLVGTNLGVTVALSIPRLQGIPKVIGRGMVSLHAHNGPVKFLSVAAAVCNRLSGPSSSAPSSTSVQPTETDDGENAQPPSDPAPTAPQGRGVWLGEAGCTTMALQDSMSSSSCGSLAQSQGSLEHGPEDGALYDILPDPAHHQRGRRTSKVDVSSLLVVSGGLGHRRVNKKAKQSRHEDTTSTIMIWQIPLLNM